MRNTLYGLIPNDVSDEVAETDVTDREKRAETASGRGIIDDFFYEQGLDPGRDPWYAFKMLNGENVGRGLLGRRGQLRIESDNEAQFKSWAAGFNEAVVDPYIDSLSHEYLLDDLHRYADNRDLERLQAGIQGGLSFDQHSDRMLAIIQGADESLDIGQFLLNDPTQLHAIANRGGQGKTRIRLNAAFTTEGKISNKVLSNLQGVDYSASASIEGYKLTDHFKFYAANIRSNDREKRAFLIGSINATQAAIGKSTNLSGRSYSSSGRNVESSFLLNYSMVENKLITPELFDSLTNQAAAAMDWVHSGRLDNGTLSFNTGDSNSHILTGSGVREAHTDLIKAIGREGGSADIITYNIGNEFLGLVEQAVRQSNGKAKFRVVLGSKYEFQPGSISLSPEHKAKHTMDRFVAKMQAAGYGDSVQFVVDNSELVHAKVSVFTLDNGTVINIYSTMNLDDNQWRGVYGADTEYAGDIRNLGLAMHSGDAAKLTGIEKAQVDSMIRTVTWMTPYAADQGPLQEAPSYSWAVMNSDMYDMELRDITKQYGLRKGTFQTVSTSEGHHAKATIGGKFSVTDLKGNTAFLDMGNLMTLTMLRSDYGYNSQIYVPELSKFIGSVVGLSTYDSKKDLAGGRAPAEFGADRVIAAGIKMVNEEVTDGLRELAKVRGADYVNRMLRDPYERGRLRQIIKNQMRDTFKNFAGFEPGTAAYSAKEFSRLLYLTDKDGRLNMRPDEDLMLDAKTIDGMVSGRFTGAKGEKFLKFTGGADLIFAAGGLSKFGPTGPSTARAYDMAMLEALPMTARLNRGGKDDKDEYLFLLPGAKLEQLPQRLQNIMSARNLNPIDLTNLDNDIADYSKLSTGPEGNKTRMRGVRLNMYMIPGMSGDNGYLIAEHMRGRYFADQAIRRRVVIADRYAIKESLSMMQDSLDELVKMGEDYAIKQGNRYVLTPLGITAANGTYDPATGKYVGGGTVNAGLHRMPGSNLTALQTMDLKAVDPNQVLILDLTPGKGVSLSHEVGKYILTIKQESAVTPHSGMRSLLGAKDPWVLAQEASPAFQSLQGMVESTADPEVLRRLNFKRGNISGFMGSGTVKYGQAFLETGIEAIESGAVHLQLQALLDKSQLRTIDDAVHRRVLADGTSSATKIDFTGLFERLKPFMEPEAVHELEFALSQARDITELSRMFDATGNYLRAQGSIGFGVKSELVHMSAAALAFGIHALYFMESQTVVNPLTGTTPLEDLNNKLNPEGSSRHGTALATQMSTLQMFGAIPLSFVTSFSASATAMSSRGRVNFLNYHSGGYTDAFYNLMSMDSKVQGRASGYRELAIGGLLGRGGVDELVLADDEFNPMTYFQEGFEDEFAEITRLTRTLQGHNGKLTAAKANETVLLIKAAIQEIDNRTAKFSQGATPLERAAFTTSGSMSSGATQSFLRAQEKAGITKSRTLLIPQLGYTDSHGVFVHDAHQATTISHRQVKFISPQGLRALGSFDDFSHRIQTLQVEIERKLDAVRIIPKLNGKVDKDGLRNLTFQQRVDYEGLMDLVAQLEMEQRSAAVTDLQKSLGGQLGMQGVNMIAGTLPELENGWMLLGSEPWEKLKTGIKTEIGRGIARYAEKRSSGLDLVSEVGFLIDDIERSTGKSLSHLKTQLEVANVRDLKLQLDAAKGTGRSDDVVRLKGQLASTRDAQHLAIDSVLETLLGDIATRAELTRGLFQRAGAPMGPLGLVVSKIILADEYNTFTGRQILLDKHDSRKAMFIYSGAMGFNLGDFDGDTASISYLQKFSELNTIKMIENQAAGDFSGSILSRKERGRLAEASKNLKYSAEEVAIRFARMYTGWGTASYGMFSDSLLYKDLTIDRAHELEEQAYRAGIAAGYKANEIQNLKADQVRALFTGDDDATALIGFRERKADMYNRAVASNKYAADIYELAFDVSEQVHKISLTNGGDSRAAYIEYFKGLGPQDVMGNRVKKAVESMNAASGGGELYKTSLQWEELITFFAMTAYASTLIMGKTFEVQYTSQLAADRAKARTAFETKNNILNIVRSDELAYGNMIDYHPKDKRSTPRELAWSTDVINAARGLLKDTSVPLTDDMRASLNTELTIYDAEQARHSDFAGIVLVMQQMAREAIKPKGGTGDAMIDKVRRFLAGRPDGSNFVASAVELASDQVRVRGLEAIYKIVEGKNFGGGDVPLHTWRYNRAVKNESGEFVRNDVASAWDLAYQDIKAALVDYYSGQIDRVYASGVASERAALLYGTDANGMSPLFGDEKQIREARKVINAQILASGGTIKGGIEEQHREVLEDYVNQQAAVRAMNVMALSREAAQGREGRKRYITAINSDSSHLYNIASATISAEDKLGILAGTTARGKMGSEEGMKLVLEDIFNTYYDQQDPSVGRTRLRDAADRASTSDTFKEQIVRMYDEYHRTGNMATAIQRAAKFAGASEAENQLMHKARLNELEAQRDAIDASTMDANDYKSQTDKINKKIKAEKDNFKAVAVARAELPELEKMLQKSVYYRNSITAAKPNQDRLAAAADVFAEASHNKIANKAGAIAGNAFANIAVPSFVAAAIGGAVGEGVQGQAGRLFETVGAMTGAAISFSNPINMISSIMRSSDKSEVQARLSISAVTMGAAIAAGHAAGYATIKAMPHAGPKLSGVAALTASSFVGMAFGMGVGALLEGMAAERGWIHTPHMSDNMTSEVHDMANDYADNQQDIEDVADGDVDDESQSYSLADGEVQEHEDFYSASWASYSVDEHYTDMTAMTDPDSHISTFESFSNTGEDGLYGDGYQGASGLHDMG